MLFGRHHRHRHVAQAVCRLRAIALDAEGIVVGDFLAGLCCRILCHSIFDLSSYFILQIYHFYGGKANNLMIVCGVLKSFSTFILLCKMKLGYTSEILKTYFGISLGLH